MVGDRSEGEGLQQPLEPRFRGLDSSQQRELLVITYVRPTEETTLKSILKDANARILDPGTWREQARLAFQGDWQALEEMQQEI